MSTLPPKVRVGGLTGGAAKEVIVSFTRLARATRNSEAERQQFFS
jgi:hypothetical protein